MALHTRRRHRNDARQQAYVKLLPLRKVLKGGVAGFIISMRVIIGKVALRTAAVQRGMPDMVNPQNINISP